MQRMIAMAVAALAAGGCLPEAERRMIVVNGEGVVMATPEVFAVKATLRTRNATQGEALEKISASLATILNSLPTLEGLESLKIDSSRAAIKPVYSGDCLESSRYRQDAACPVESYLAEIGVTATGSPAGAAGNALSLLIEFGAEEADVEGFMLADPEAAKGAATEAAMKDARSKASKLAAGAGATLGAPVRIQYGDGFGEGGYDERLSLGMGQQEKIVITGSRITPRVGLVLSPQPFEVREKVTAAFAID